MNPYELVLILKEEADAQIKKIQAAVEQSGGAVTSTEKWGKKDFAYPVKKLTSGYYFIWRLNLPQNKISDFKKQMDYDENIVRYLLLKSEIKNPNEK